MIAVDAKGGDRAPQAPVLGALRAARLGIPITLYGDETQMTALLDSAWRSWRRLPLLIKHCPGSIDMSDEASRAVVRKKDSSLVCAVQAVADGQAQAIVSAGNSGAMLVAGSLILGRVNGISRPAIGQFLPTKKGSLFCLDLGANTNCKPLYLEQFAIIGSTYVRLFKNIKNPRVALLSNGAEPGKGSVLVKEAYDRLQKASINFVGNLEAHDIFDDCADVLVCDGFTGNVLLKAVEGTAQAVGYWLQKERRASWLGRIRFLAASALFKPLYTKTDYSRKGGALLLGVKSPMIFAHGASDARAMFYAIQGAHTVVQKNMVGLFNEQLRMNIEKNAKVAFRVAQKVRSIFRSIRS